MAYQPKSYKKFVATAATATLVASAVAPVAFAAKPAAEFTDVAPQYKEAVDYLVDNMIAAGKTPTTFGTAENIIRVDAAIWIAKATLTDGEISDAPASNFSDVPDRGKIYVDALKFKGYVNGTDATTYNSYANISRGEVAMILAEAYDIEGNTANNKFTDVNSRYLAAVSALKDNGITNGKTTTSFGTGDAITRGELAIWVHRLETLKIDSLEVVSANAINAKEFQVKFNTALDATDAKDLSNYTLVGETFTNAVVSEDGRTVTLTSATDINVTNAKLTVLPIKTKADATVFTKEYNALYTYGDTLNPALVGVVKAEGTTAELSFTEPLQSAGTVSLNGVELPSTRYSLDGNKLTINGLEAEKTYQVTIVGAKDFAGNTANSFTTSFTVAKPVVDTLKPVGTVSVTGTMVTVDFSEKLQATGGSFATVAINGQTYTLTATEQKADDETVFTFNAASALGSNNFINTTVTVSNFKDAAGNAGDTFATNATLAKDTVLPVYTGATSKLLVADNKTVTTDEDAIYLTFSEPVTVIGDLTLKSKDGILFSQGTVVPVNTTSGFDVDGNGKVEGNELNTIKITTDLDASTAYEFTLSANSVKDSSNNALETATSVKFTSGVYTAPTPTANANVEFGVVNTISNTQFTVTYSENVTNTALNTTNYTLDGKNLPAGTTINFIDGTNKVLFTLPTGSVLANGNYSLKAKNVVAVDGDTLKGGEASTFVPLKENIVPTATSLVVNSSSVFTVSFTEAVTTAGTPVTGATVKVNGNTVAATLTVTTDGKLQVSVQNNFNMSDAISIEFKNTNLQDANGNTVKDGTVNK